MKPSTARKVQESYRAVAPRIGEVVDRFYQRVFDRRPEIADLFPKDMTLLKGHLAAAVALIARNADRMEAMEESLMALGARHVRYGARFEDYAFVMDALVTTLGELAGELWTPSLEQAWRDLVGEVSAAMLRGAAMATWDGKRSARAARFE